MKRSESIKLLQKALEKQSNVETKQWFENYLKGVIKYRGVKVPQIIVTVKQWRKANHLELLDSKRQLEIAAGLIRQRYAEDKFAGILYIQSFLLKEIEFETFASLFEQLFEESCFFDWSTTDWFNVRVLSPLIALHGRRAANRIASWYKSNDLWQRRSSIVALRQCVRSAEYTPIVERQIKRLVKSDERFIQTGIGWVIADLAKSNPKEAARLVDKFFEDYSFEVIRRHTKNLPKHKHYIEQKKRQKLGA